MAAKLAEIVTPVAFVGVIVPTAPVANNDVPAKSTITKTPSVRLPTLPVTSNPVKLILVLGVGEIDPTEPVANKLANPTCTSSPALTPS